MENNMAEKVLLESDVDRLGQAVLALTQEIWVLKDRQRVLEAALEEAGVLNHAALNEYSPDEGLSQELEVERKQLIDNILQALTKSPFESSAS
jgi:hypothetical protein